jgi:thymidylate synthase
MVYVENSPDYQYKVLVEDIIRNGTIRTGRNGNTISVFTRHLAFDLTKGFPLLTTKKMFTRGIIEELLFFLRGETNSKKLEDKKINIWKGNTSREFLDSIGMNDRDEGIMGPMYGAQWRAFNGKYDAKTGNISGGIDQLLNVINMIKDDPMSRRILMTDFNPSQVDECVLYPCHSIILQFYVSGEYLDLFCFNRSSDIGLGLPFNIASTSLLLSLIAKMTGLTARICNITLGDAHIYSQHTHELSSQVRRTPYISPKLIITGSVDDISSITADQFKFIDYKSHPSVKMEMVA